MLGWRVKISPPILALWVALHSMAVSGCSAPDLTFADEMVDGKTPAVLPDAVVALPDAPTGGPRYLGGDGTVTASNGSYRFNVTANNGSTNFQVAEIELFGY